MEKTKPSDFLPLKEWQREYGQSVFSSAKMLHYHTHPIQRELIEAGAMAKIGVQIFCTKIASGLNISASSPANQLRELRR